MHCHLELLNLNSSTQSYRILRARECPITDKNHHYYLMILDWQTNCKKTTKKQGVAPVTTLRVLGPQACLFSCTGVVNKDDSHCGSVVPTGVSLLAAPEETTTPYGAGFVSTRAETTASVNKEGRHTLLETTLSKLQFNVSQRQCLPLTRKEATCARLS